MLAAAAQRMRNPDNPGIALFAQREQRLRVWKAQPPYAHISTTRALVLTLLSPGSSGLGLREDLCLHFHTSLMLLSSHTKAMIRMDKGWDPASKVSVTPG